MCHGWYVGMPGADLKPFNCGTGCAHLRRQIWPCGAGLAKLAEEILNFSGKRGRLLHSGEMAAFFHFRPALNVGVGFFRD